MLPIGRPDVHAQIYGRLTWRDWRPMLAAAGLTTAAVAILVVAFGTVSAAERPVALESLTSSLYWLAAAAIGACGTIAALTLTTLSLMEHLDTRQMGPGFLFQMRLTALGALATIALAVGALLLTTFPFAAGADTNPPRWQIDTVYFALLAVTALMVGGFAVVLSSLYATIGDVFRHLPTAWVEDIMAEDDPAPGRDDDVAERTEEAVERVEGATDRIEGATDRIEDAAGRVVGVVERVGSEEPAADESRPRVSR